VDEPGAGGKGRLQIATGTIMSGLMKGINKVAARSGSGVAKRPSPSPRRPNGQKAQSADGAKDRQFVTALARGLQILGCFSSAHPEWSGTEIAALLGLPQPTVWRLCRTMMKLGYLAADGEDRLRPALPALRLGYTLLSNMTIGELARPHLQELAEEVGGAAGLAVRDGSDMRFIERCESDSQLLMSLRVGSRVPIATSAMGWAYLAGLPHDERDAVIEEVKPNQQIWKKAEGPLRSALKSFERDGFILNEGVLHPGYVTVAAPVIGRNGLPAFAVNCGGAISAVKPGTLKTKIGPRLGALAVLLESIVAFADPELPLR
jgi:DNA-binding IclR family transcriptional regulator